MSNTTDLTFGSLNLSLHVFEIDVVLPHEETIQELTDSLAAEILKDKVQIDPIIVDAKSHVILDGTHRISALKSLGCKAVVTCSLDYSNPSVIVERWIRCLSSLPDALLTELEEAFRLYKTDTHSAMDEVDQARAALAIITSKTTYLSRKEFASVEDAYSLVRRFDGIVWENGLRFATLTEQLALNTIGAPYEAALYTHPVKKADVLRSGLNRRLFPPKSTRHLIPVRPVGVMYPLDHLRHFSAADAESSLRQILESSTPVTLAPGSTYRGRTYDESLLQIRGN